MQAFPVRLELKAADEAITYETRHVRDSRQCDPGHFL